MTDDMDFVQLQHSLEELPDITPEDPADHGETAVCLITLNGDI